MKKYTLKAHSSKSLFAQQWLRAVKPGCFAMALLVASALPAVAQNPVGGVKM